MIPSSPLHKKFLTLIGLLSLVLVGGWLLWHGLLSLLRVVDWLFAVPLALYDPLTMVGGGILLFGLLWCAPLFLAVWGLAALNASRPTRWSPAARARLVTRLRRQEQHRRTAALAWQTPWQQTPKPPQPFTPAQQAFYDDMRAKGWSDLASRQAAERLQA